MRILKLTDRVEGTLLAVRKRGDLHAEKVAAKIVRDVRRRGDAALFSWTRELDGVDLARRGVWISHREIEKAQKVSVQLSCER